MTPWTPREGINCLHSLIQQTIMQHLLFNPIVVWMVDADADRVVTQPNASLDQENKAINSRLVNKCVKPRCTYIQASHYSACRQLEWEHKEGLEGNR